MNCMTCRVLVQINVFSLSLIVLPCSYQCVRFILSLLPCLLYTAYIRATNTALTNKLQHRAELW